VLDSGAFNSAAAPTAHETIVEDGEQPVAQAPVELEVVLGRVRMRERLLDKVIGVLLPGKHACVAPQRRELLDRLLAEPVSSVHWA